MKREGDDFVTEARRVVEQVCLKLHISPQVAAMVAAEWDTTIRRDYGGTKDVYICKTVPPTEEQKRLALEYANKTGNPREAASKAGISRAHMYRILKMGRRG
jgi:transcriptional regulator of acetoin/glycerol metabolism